MKVVINRCYGGFGLSDAAIEQLIELGMTVSSDHNDRDVDIWETEEKDRILGSKYYINESYQPSFRSDPRVVQVVEEMGEDSYSRFSKLSVVEVPDDASWIIEEYDGMEWVAETHRTWR